MKKGVQQIMLGTVTSSEKKALETLRAVKRAGYDGLELNRFMIHESSLMVRLLTRAAGMPTGRGGKLDWHGLLKETGLEVISLHTDLGTLEREGDMAAQEAESFGTDKVVITGMYRFEYGSEEAVRDLALRLNRAGEKLKQGGISLLYHNHNAELLQVKPGSRMKLWHVTDRGSRISGPVMTPILKSDSVELGTGNMDLEGLLEIGKGCGLEALVLESHKNWIRKDPVKSLEMSAGWLKERC